MNSQATEYLTEASLGRFLRERVDPAIVAGQLIPGISRRYQPDFRSERHRFIVEFDGDEHYRSAKKILGDEERDKALASVGYRIVRIPYIERLEACELDDFRRQAAQSQPPASTSPSAPCAFSTP